MARDSRRALTGDLLRYGLALAGPIGSAGAQFLLSLVLLRQVDPAGFGRFSFLLIASQLGSAIWSALFWAPLPLVLSAPRGAGTLDPARTMLSANLCGVVLALAPFALIARGVGESWSAVALFAAFAALALLRGFARALGYARARQRRVSGSDLLYSVALLIGTALLFGGVVRGTAGAYGVFLVATVAGLLAFGPGVLAEQITAFSVAHLADYRRVWRAHGRWSLLGVVTSEATVNAHAYLVTGFLGAGAFAPLAAAAILIRPITVVFNALTEFERARIARALGADDFAEARRAVRLFRTILLLSWLATGIATIALLWFDPRLIYPPQYHRRTLAIGAALWMVTALFRVMRVPEGTLLQAGGAFRPLALASLWSAFVSVAAVAGLLLVAAPLWSILGVALGDAVCAALILRAARLWYGRAAAPALSPAS
ncbi:hypothetical protein [Sphingomonas sp. NFR15]|uniref:hypothetical protein n=1 Tax=Sphingomonas sp. NFR15 TaxID=1566282 RepID=UPI00088355DA|nr:hypothetical protein [Sphingomonas sp. NFR15]SDA36729.1 Membrane protein involved in the export of O-antigen and teichoic acid [Sphingomonas sp. NFR15]